MPPHRQTARGLSALRRPSWPRSPLASLLAIVRLLAPSYSTRPLPRCLVCGASLERISTRRLLPFSRHSVIAVPFVRHASTNLTPTHLDSFPICDDSSEFGDQRHPPLRRRLPSGRPFPSLLRVRRGRGCWFPPAGGCSTPTPAQRRRNHRRVPSEGVFHMSSDEGSPSSFHHRFVRASSVEPPCQSLLDNLLSWNLTQQTQ